MRLFLSIRGTSPLHLSNFDMCTNNFSSENAEKTDRLDYLCVTSLALLFTAANQGQT